MMSPPPINKIMLQQILQKLTNYTSRGYLRKKETSQHKSVPSSRPSSPVVSWLTSLTPFRPLCRCRCSAHQPWLDGDQWKLFLQSLEKSIRRFRLSICWDAVHASPPVAARSAVSQCHDAAPRTIRFPRKVFSPAKDSLCLKQDDCLGSTRFQGETIDKFPLRGLRALFFEEFPGEIPVVIKFAW